MPGADMPDSTPPGAAGAANVPPKAAPRAPRPAMRWYVAQTLPRKELWAIANLQRLGFKTFFPRFRQLVPGRTRPQARLSPLFPGYVFVAFDAAQHHWTSIRGTLGVRQLIGPAQERPQPVPTRTMNYLLARCTGEVMMSLLDDLKPGDVVQINSGPLFRRIAQVQSLPKEGRVRLLFEMLGASHSIEVETSTLSPVT